MTDDGKKLAELLRRAKLTQAQAQPPKKGEKDPALDVGATGPVDFVKSIQEVQEAARTINTTKKIVTETGIGAWNFVRPLWQNRVSQWCWRKYKNMIDKFCYTTNQATGKRKLSATKTGAFALATYTALAAILPFLPGAALVQNVVVEPAVDAAVMVKDVARMQFSYTEKQIFYMNRESQTSDGAKDGTYSVKATTEDQQHNFNFIIKPGFLHSQWYLKNRSSLLYNTDVIAAKIPSGEVAKCEATWYGSYNPFLLYMGSKPVLLDAKCEAVKTSFNDAVTATPTVQIAAASVQASISGPGASR